VQRHAFDAAYVQRLCDSDYETERDFAAYFTELLEIKLRARLRSADRMRDVIQETFVRVMKTLRTTGVKDPQALGSFVNSVCNNVLFEVYRDQARFSGPLEERPSEVTHADDAIAGEQQRMQVRRVMAELPEKDRTILRWLFFDERDKTDICRALQVDREYLRVLLHRAKLRFRDDYLKRAATKSDRPTPLG
jgi:RNA polymerase sigma-70 factor (ECF subfamily)